MALPYATPNQAEKIARQIAKEEVGGGQFASRGDT